MESSDNITIPYEDLRDDPYGTAVTSIRRILRIVLDERVSGAMSADEHANLIAFEEIVRQRDNA